FPGLSESRLLLEDDSLTASECVQAFLNMGIPEVVLKLGSEGAISATPLERTEVEAFPVQEVDYVGAGDGFCAGYLVGYLNGLSLKERTKLANAVGAIVVGKKGDYEGLPTMAEVEQFLGKRKIVTR
ncbi:carbohydrate kinase family protein, partial [Bacillus cereus]|uniref:carbohydrate kinase family protein n=1 Tax=Bacillus cereus TaxID=1396 RepID=UPI0036714A57